ncbi:MAG: NAD(P)H-dependent oxidoreductase [Microbacterium sp.]|jgi:NAD(P)H-dependent FMN reductase|uniref:NADPH-dependent FMN reductase n=1 Tax=Microbacterium sp. TaxID=51671 RepID=UPI00282FF5EA|nr:NAD(P)H-dependent oxidoreductase [Microbacterium sp.]MDR2322952.1 NAD(P)H-dependent oxidoreductase [Microbacterium sp.]
MTKIAIILGSTRPGRNGKQVADWVLQQAAQRDDAEFELVDLADYPLPHLDEPMPPAMGRYQHDHTREWSDKISGFDGYIFVTPEYNHSTSGVLKNAIDYLHTEWNNKAAAFVGYGGVGGARAIEHLRLVLAELQVATVRQTLTLSLMTEFENFQTFAPGDYQADFLNTLFDQLIAWANALETVRNPELAELAA